MDADLPHVRRGLARPVPHHGAGQPPMPALSAGRGDWPSRGHRAVREQHDLRRPRRPARLLAVLRRRPAGVVPVWARRRWPHRPTTTSRSANGCTASSRWRPQRAWRRRGPPRPARWSTPPGTGRHSPSAYQLLPRTAGDLLRRADLRTPPGRWCDRCSSRPSCSTTCWPAKVPTVVFDQVGADQRASSKYGHRPRPAAAPTASRGWPARGRGATSTSSTGLGCWASALTQ